MSSRPTRIALLDSSGADFEFIGIVIGHPCELNEISNKLSRRRVHMRELSRERRRRIARAFLDMVSRRLDALILSLRTHLSTIIRRLREERPRIPSSRARALCFRALSLILADIIYQHPVSKIVADREFELLWNSSGVRLASSEPDNPLLGLADIAAWINNQVARRKLKLGRKHSAIIRKIDIMDKLRSSLRLAG